MHALIVGGLGGYGKSHRTPDNHQRAEAVTSSLYGSVSRAGYPHHFHLADTKHFAARILIVSRGGAKSRRGSRGPVGSCFECNSTEHCDREKE